MIQTGDVQRVEVIEVEHVLAAMQELGWMPGERPPPLAAIQTKLRQKYKNGGHTNRLSRLREEAMALSGSPACCESRVTPTEAAEAAPLPEPLERRLSDLAAGVSGILVSLHNDLAAYLASYRAETDRDATTRIDAAVKNAHERIAAAEEELDAALVACNVSADRIGDLTSALVRAQSAADTATGKAEAVAGELAAARTQLTAAEQAGAAARDAMATATGKADAVERELVSRASRVSELEEGLATAQAALATMAGKAEVTDAELQVRDARIVDLDARNEALTIAAAKANGRAEAMEHELDARTTTLAVAEASLIKALAESAAATSRAEMLNAEATKLRERIKALEDEKVTGSSAAKCAATGQAAPARKRGKEVTREG